MPVSRVRNEDQRKVVALHHEIHHGRPRRIKPGVKSMTASRFILTGRSGDEQCSIPVTSPSSATEDQQLIVLLEEFKTPPSKQPRWPDPNRLENARLVSFSLKGHYRPS